jgi:hypothetical protein
MYVFSVIMVLKRTKTRWLPMIDPVILTQHVIKFRQMIQSLEDDDIPMGGHTRQAYLS